ncbi:hypothetical protein P7979_09575, partial [Staphylococcus aureus]|nr:hypothetical protein [Staphylococcus aureus]MDM6274899.1 hypothetical protein [Staphylococcus aureus]
KTKIEDIFHGCLRFFGSKGTNGSAPSFLLVRKALIFIGLHNINIVNTKPKTFLLKAITSYLI